MKTTIDLPNPLFRELRQWAARHDMTMREVLETALRRLFGGREATPRRFRLRRHSFKGRGLSPDLSSGGWEAIRHRAYEGHGG